MSDTDTGPSAMPPSDESEFARMVQQFGADVEEIELTHRVGDLVITRRIRLAARASAKDAA